MQLASHLRISRHGVFQYRLVLPDLVAATLGQREIIMSLKTKRPERARLTAYALSARIVPVLRQMRRILAIDPNSIDPGGVRELIVKGLKIAPDGTMTADHIETSDDPVIAAKELRALEKLRHPVPELRPISPEGAAELRSLREDLAAIVDAGMAKPKGPPSQPTTIAAAITSFLTYKKGTSKTTQKSYKGRLSVFARLAGGDQQMLHEITPEKCARICEALNVLPTHKRSNLDAETLLANPPTGRTLAPPTIKDVLVLYQDFFEWAIKTKRYVGDNPIADAPRPSEGTNGSGGAEAFLQSELETIFRPENFMTAKRPHQFWGPLFGLFTGARSNEIAQLRVDDITREDGILCMSITHEPEAAVPTRTKNKDSIRLLPLHPRLLEIGFEVYWNDMKSVGAKRLFGLPTSDEGKCEKYLSRDFNEGLLRDRLHIHRPRKTTFHSFRDTCNNLLANSDTHPFYINQWMGRATKTVEGEHYLNILPPRPLSEKTWPSLNHDYLDLSGIRYKNGWWNAWAAKQLIAKPPRKKQVSEGGGTPATTSRTKKGTLA